MRTAAWTRWALAGALALGACGGGGGKDAAGGPSTTTAAASLNGGGEGDGGSGPSTTAKGSRHDTTTTLKGAATTTSTAPRPAPPLRPPAPGTYTYATSGAYTYGGRDHALPPRTTLVVDPASGASQHSARNLRDADGNGPIVETLLRYEAEGLWLDMLGYTNRVEGVDDARQYRPNPPVLIAPRNAEVGYKASYDGADGGTSVHVDSVIERRDTVVVDGRPVDCYFVRAVTTFHGTVEGSGEGTSCVSVEYRLLLTEDVRTTFTVGPTTVKGAYRATIEHLTPA